MQEVVDGGGYFARRPGERGLGIGECGGLTGYVPGHTTGDYPPVHNFVPTGDDFRPSLWDGKRLEKHYADWVDGLWLLRSQGLCAAIYTQIYDTGGECNGWLTYDRAVSKIPVETLKRLHDRLYRPLPEWKPIVPMLPSDGQTCRWQRAPAPDGWEQPQFDDSEWSLTETPLPATGQRCVRRKFILDRVPNQAALCVEGWAEFTVWLNGRHVQTISNGRTERYTPRSLVLLSPNGLTALHLGENVIAVATNPSAGKMRKREGVDADDRLDFGLIDVITQE